MASTSRAAFFRNVPFSITVKQLNQCISEIVNEIESLRNDGDTYCKNLQELLQKDRNWTMPSFLGIPPGHTSSMKRRKEYLEKAKQAHDQLRLCVDLFSDAVTAMDALNAYMPEIVPEVASASSLSSSSSSSSSSILPTSAPTSSVEFEHKLSKLRHTRVTYSGAQKKLVVDICNIAGVDKTFTAVKGVWGNIQKPHLKQWVYRALHPKRLPGPKVHLEFEYDVLQKVMLTAIEESCVQGAKPIENILILFNILINRKNPDIRAV